MRPNASWPSFRFSREPPALTLGRSQEEAAPEPLDEDQYHRTDLGKRSGQFEGDEMRKMK